ncbi:hypothetical protein [Amycolatopsis tolypomycina]|uniref:hypothetical protein n=1 Tax=Amycolatopsis tolypomycina TaxID=208445 RepID=UPI0033A45E3C
MRGFDGSIRPPLPGGPLGPTGLSFLATGYVDARTLIEEMVAGGGAPPSDLPARLDAIALTEPETPHQDYFAGFCNGLAEAAERMRAAVMSLQDDWIDNAEHTPRWIGQHLHLTDGLDDPEVLALCDRADEIARTAAGRAGVRLPHQLSTAETEYQDGLRVIQLAARLDTCALLSQPALAEALDITDPAVRRDRAAAEIATTLWRHPRTAELLPPDRRAVLQELFPGTDLGEPAPTPVNRRAAFTGDEAQFREFFLDARQLVMALPGQHEPGAPSTAGAVERVTALAARRRDLVAALPPLCAAVVRAVTQHRPVAAPARPAGRGEVRARIDARARPYPPTTSATTDQSARRR